MTAGTVTWIDAKVTILASEPGILASVSTDRVELFTSLLALIALAGSIVYALATGLVGTRSSTESSAVVEFARSMVSDVERLALWLAFVVAAASTAGSLYFSEVAEYVPCQLCWFQRICMYPLTGILGVAALRRDITARWMCLPMLIAGVCLSTYHYIIEWKPSLGEGACSVGPACTDIWFRRMGFVTLAFMALTGFVTITVLLFVRTSRTKS